MHRFNFPFTALIGVAGICIGSTCAAQYQASNAPQQIQYPQQYGGNVHQQGTVQQFSQPQYGHPQSVQPPITNAIHSTGSHWSQNLLSERTRDFGAVPRASKQEHVFEFKNPLDTELYLTAVRTSCGCTKPKILTPVVKPGDVARLHTKYDTVSFKGEKSATVTLSLRRDRPYAEYAEVQFVVRGKIRQDVVTVPGEVDFGEVLPGNPVVKSIKVMYAGDPRWEIVDVKSTNPNVLVEANQLQRNKQTGRIDYELSVKLLGEQPIGSFADELILVTNDVRNKSLPIKFSGRIKPVLEASPIQLGVITKGQEIQKRLILRGIRAFRVQSITPPDTRIQFESNDGEKSLHILKYKLDTSEVGQIKGVITIVTSDPDQPETKIPFTAQVVPQTFASGN